MGAAHIKVAQPSGKTIELENIQLSTSVEELKKIIGEREGINRIDQRLLYLGRYMYDEDNLANYQIQDQATINLELKVPGNTLIKVELPDNRPMMTMEVHPTHRVGDIKAQIYSYTYTNPSLIELYRKSTNTLMNDSELLSKFNIARNEVLKANFLKRLI